MKSVYVKFKNNEEISKFVNTICDFECDFDLVKGRKNDRCKILFRYLVFWPIKPSPFGYLWWKWENFRSYIFIYRKSWLKYNVWNIRLVHYLKIIIKNKRDKLLEVITFLVAYFVLMYRWFYIRNIN